MRLGFKTHWADRLQGVLRRRESANGANGVALAAPAVRVDKAWDEAFLRVESYLRAHHLESRVLLAQLTSEIIQVARELSAQLPAEPPVTLALRVAHARIGEWLQPLLPDGNWADERFRARGRLALLMSELPQRCPERFLAAEPPPASVAQRLASASLLPAPELRPTPMPPAMLEFPLVEIAEEKWVTFSRSTFTRSAASWVVFIGLLGVAWFATR